LASLSGQPGSADPAQLQRNRIRSQRLHTSGRDRLPPSPPVGSPIVGLPVLPLGRYYPRETAADLAPDYGLYHQTTSTYQVAGTARLCLDEVLRTYAFGWLTPAAAIWPLIALLHRADALPVWVPIVAVVCWPSTATALAVMGLMYYRKNWAPLREVRWRGRHRPAMRGDETTREGHAEP
jgi:hypothetical protein